MIFEQTTKAVPCMLRRMRSLETAAQAGVVIVAVLAGIIVLEAALDGFPAIADGELPLWGLKVGALQDMAVSCPEA